MAQNVIVGGDFRKLLNALSHVDEQAIAEVLPFRRGATGLHLIEALALAAELAKEHWFDLTAARRVLDDTIRRLATTFGATHPETMRVRTLDVVDDHADLAPLMDAHRAEFLTLA